jgi:hypothetical protein
MADFGHDLFRIFRTISDHSPNDTILRYIHDPSSIPAWTPPRAVASKKWLFMIGGAALLGLIAAAAALVAAKLL